MAAIPYIDRSGSQYRSQRSLIPIAAVPGTDRSGPPLRPRYFAGAGVVAGAFFAAFLKYWLASLKRVLRDGVSFDCVLS